MVDVTPGDSGANKGFWRYQLRDRFGRFVEMGGGVIFEVSLPGFTGIARAKGIFRGMADLETAEVEVLDDSEIPRGTYKIDRKFIEAAPKGKAKLSEEYVEKKLGRDIPTAGDTPESKELKKSISGEEALKIRTKSVARYLKEKGRFPLTRYTQSYEMGKTSDTAEGAKLDYKKVFDSSPEVREFFASSDELWDYVVRTSTGGDSQSPNDLSEINEKMKAVNRAYARHILGLEPDGFITVYRNATNGKDKESESAVGYVSLDRQMAYDYNSQKPQRGSDGRYEIDVKPDEVVGHLGYSQFEDEYGLVIGRGVTEQEGRVRRVGDLAMPVLPHWLEDWNKGFSRGVGNSPFRKFGVAASYDFHEVEDFGSSAQEFFQKYGLEAADISKKFDELYGEGAYAKYKESGNVVNFAKLKSMFVTLDNGNIGIDAEALDKLSGLKDSSEYVGDLFDNTMKMLSVFQELTGKYFMTHKTRDYTPPEAPSNPSPEKVTLGDTTWDAPPTEAQAKAIEDYGSGELAGDGNVYLRTGDLPKPYARMEGEPEFLVEMKAQMRAEVEEKIQALSSAFEGAVLNKDMTLYRSLSDPSFGFDYGLELEEGEVLDLSRLEGTIYTDKGFISTTKKDDFSYISSPIRLKINAKAGQKAIDLGAVINLNPREHEVLLPAGSKFRISKAYYDSNANKYHVEMDYLDGDASDSPA